MEQQQIKEYIETIPDDVLTSLMFSMPWQGNGQPEKDEDGFSSKPTKEMSYADYQTKCWEKFNKSPHIRTSVTDTMGRICGRGFGIWSMVEEIQDVIDEIVYDPRNRLMLYLPKFVARADIEGELFLCLTIHKDGFVEIDFRDPGTVDKIHFHPAKPTMPLLYDVLSPNTLLESGGKEQIPGIFLARYPELWKQLPNVLSPQYLQASKSPDAKYRKLDGYFRFIVAWDKGFLTERNISHISTTLEWLNYYENLKKYEIDHKKSSGAYVWVVQCTDPKAFRLWMGMTDDQRKQTGLTASKTPGSTLVVPPGFEVKAVNPNLTKISDADTDILSMVIAGLNKPADVITGESKGNFASVKASRGPMSDRVSDEITYFERFLCEELFAAIFFLRSAVTNFPTEFKRRVAVSFTKDKTPVMKIKRFPPHRLLEVTFPISQIDDLANQTKAVMGVKHGRLSKTLGIPNAELARKIGFQNYHRLRLDLAAEEDYYPELEPDVDAESLQEIEEGEAPKSGIKKAPKGEEVKDPKKEVKDPKKEVKTPKKEVK